MDDVGGFRICFFVKDYKVDNKGLQFFYCSEENKVCYELEELVAKWKGERQKDEA